jgi:hypothetical protein
MSRFLAITFAAAVAGCLSYPQTDAVSDGGQDPTIFYVDGTWIAGYQVITFDQVIAFSLPNIP